VTVLIKYVKTFKMLWKSCLQYLKHVSKYFTMLMKCVSKLFFSNCLFKCHCVLLILKTSDTAHAIDKYTPKQTNLATIWHEPGCGRPLREERMENTTHLAGQLTGANKIYIYLFQQILNFFYCVKFNKLLLITM